MLNLTCPRSTGTFDRPVTCGADATVLEIAPANGEFTAWCAAHAPEAVPGDLLVHASGPLHSTSLFTR